MNTLAYCAYSFYHSVKRASWAEPITSPPTDLHSFPIELLCLSDFVYLKLHGLENEPYLYGDNWATALTCDQIAALDLSNTVVFSACCFFLDSPWPAAFEAANTKALLAGHGPNLARSQSVAGVDRLGRRFAAFLSYGASPETAFAVARRSLRPFADAPTQDALAFKLYTRKNWGSEPTPNPTDRQMVRPQTPPRRHLPDYLATMLGRLVQAEPKPPDKETNP